LELALDEFGRRFLRRVGNRYALLDRSTTGDCVMLENGRCTIYADRPAQCRSFPFWAQHLRSLEAWADAGRDCEGISPSSPIVSFEAIERLRQGG
jgi:Fe-S-cluster containining protein